MRRTDKTLIEQMKISDIEIDNRKKLLGIDNHSIKLLSQYRESIEENIDFIVNEFYRKQTEVDEIALLIGDADTLARLHNAMRKYVIDLFLGNYNHEYVNNRLRIGMVHKRIGVEPKLYISAVKILKDIISKVLKKNITKNEDFLEAMNALDRILYFDIIFVFDTYIDSLIGEIQAAKRKIEQYAKSLEEKVAERTKQLEEQAKLDPLTNLYNQRAMHDLLKRYLASTKRRNSVLSFVYFDIDNFKHINDTYGHVKGDEVLQNIGKILLESIREDDMACRYGGDEFCLILPECNIENAKAVCKKIINKFNQIYPNFSISMGISGVEPGNYVDKETLIKSADEKMYLAKKEKSSFICA